MAFTYALVLTGSIGTGKSAAAKILASLGFTIIDADKIAHEVLQEQAAKIVEMFGDSMLRSGKVDRKALGAIVFSDESKRKMLEALVHPLIYHEIERRSCKEDNFEKPYLVDIPLFFEGKRYPIDRSLVVYARVEQQLARLMEREGYSKEEAQQRIATQIPVEDKRNMANYVIDNTGTLAQLKDECKRVKKEILHDCH